MSVQIELNERLANLLKHDVRFILKDIVLRNEYIALHTLIEGSKPSCTGCSASSKLSSWKSKVNVNNKVKLNKSKKQKVMSNTFKLKKGRLRVSVPYTGSVITEHSKDELVHFYLDGAKTEDERKRREAFFEVLPEPVKKKRKPKAKKEVAAKISAPEVSEETKEVVGEVVKPKKKTKKAE